MADSEKTVVLQILGRHFVDIDNTLTEHGKAADAHATGSAIAECVKKSGDTMSGRLTIGLGAYIKGSGWNSIAFIDSDGKSRCDIMTNGGTDTKKNFGKMIFDQYVFTEDGTQHIVVGEDGNEHACQERFQLPSPTQEDFVNGIFQTWYGILTTKYAVTIAQGGTGGKTIEEARSNLKAASNEIIYENASGSGTAGIDFKKTGVFLVMYTHNASGSDDVNHQGVSMIWIHDVSTETNGTMTYVKSGSPYNVYAEFTGTANPILRIASTGVKSPACKITKVVKLSDY